ncbi:MAG: hypothetical protein RL732_551 [Bacteroidota bacterium]
MIVQKIATMQTILGATGPIGTELAQALRNYTNNLRLVSRNPHKLHESDACVAADLTHPASVMKAVEGSEVCYLTAGLEYKTRVWQAQWPLIIKNVVQACEQHGSKLVFFDNIYALSKDHLNNITESTPIAPCSEKGKVRAWVDRYIMEEVEKGKLKAIIARAPDFFGPYRKNSVLISTVYDNLEKGKKAQWFCNANVKHSFGFIPDLAKGTALLGNTATAFDQIWNLPVEESAPTGNEWVDLFAETMHKKAGVQVLPGAGIKLLGWFIPILKEMYEMRYQYDRNYYFNAEKFRKAFQYTPLANKEAVRLTVQSMPSR